MRLNATDRSAFKLQKWAQCSTDILDLRQIFQLTNICYEPFEGMVVNKAVFHSETYHEIRKHQNGVQNSISKCIRSEDA